MGIGKALRGFGIALKGNRGKTVVKDTNPPMIKIKSKPKGSTPKNLNDQKKVYVSDKPAVLGKETYNYDGLKEVKKGTSMKKKSEPIKLPSKKGGSTKKSGTTLSAIKESNPALYKKYMRNLGKKTSKPSSFSERRMTLKGPKNANPFKDFLKKTIPAAGVAQGTTSILGKNKKKEKK